MSETVNQEQIATNEQPKEQPKAEEKLFTQEEVNKFFDRRYAETMSRLKEYETKAKKFDEMEEANKSELQKATERAEKLQAELNSIKKSEEIRLIREKVAKEEGIPASSLSLITGETEEACREQAKLILNISQPGSYPHIPDGGEPLNTNKASTRDLFKEFAVRANS
jgi:hypothetical protein